MNPAWRASRDPGDSTVRLEGELDLAAAERLERELLTAVKECDGELHVDLVAVTYLDSSAIRALLRASALASDDGKRLRISGASGVSRRVLEIAGVDKVLGLDDGASES
jgi:anti-sigma B factor antagonist